jgi:hypothetical protein
MDRIGKQLLAEKELALDPGNSEMSDNDILSLLVRANASGAKHQRLPEEQVLARKFDLSLSLISLISRQKFQLSLSPVMKQQGDHHFVKNTYGILYNAAAQRRPGLCSP